VNIVVKTEIKFQVNDFKNPLPTPVSPIQTAVMDGFGWMVVSQTQAMSAGIFSS